MQGNQSTCHGCSIRLSRFLIAVLLGLPQIDWPTIAKTPSRPHLVALCAA